MTHACRDPALVFACDICATAPCKMTKSPAATGQGVQAGFDSEKESGKLPSRTTWLPVPVRDMKSKQFLVVNCSGS